MENILFYLDSDKNFGVSYDEKRDPKFLVSCDKFVDYETAKSEHNSNFDRFIEDNKYISAFTEYLSRNIHIDDAGRVYFQMTENGTILPFGKLEDDVFTSAQELNPKAYPHSIFCTLTSYELRQIWKYTTENNLYTENVDKDIANIPWSRNVVRRFLDGNLTIKTDLHTHINAILSGKEILDLAVKYNIKVQEGLLQNIMNVANLYYPDLFTLAKNSENLKKYFINELGVKFEKVGNDGKQIINISDIVGVEPRTGLQKQIFDCLVNYLDIPDYKTAENQNKIIGLRSSLLSVETIEYTTERDDIKKVVDLEGKEISTGDMYLYSYLMKIAENYKENGIEYAEIDIDLNDTNMNMINRIMPLIERDIKGITMRFLDSSSRKQNMNSDKIQGKFSNFERYQLNHKYVVGADIMGFENNNILNTANSIALNTLYAMRYNPNFVVRIHAGERRLGDNKQIINNNILNSLKLIKKVHDTYNKNLPYPQIRIGHGVYFDNETREELFNLMKEMDVVVEMNISSNLALENVDSYLVNPIKEYINNGIKVVLGSDGQGMYGTSALQEMLIASQLLDDSENIALLDNENEILERRGETKPIRELTEEDMNKMIRLVEECNNGLDSKLANDSNFSL